MKVEPPSVKDGDVSCAGGGAGLDEAEDVGQSEYSDPGPVPQNIYDRGFVENWKEVLFPISLRKEAYAMGGYSRQSRPKPKAEESSVNSKPTASTIPPPQSNKTD